MLENINTQQDINKSLMNLPREVSNKDITQIVLDEWRGSDPIKNMVEANAYYLVKNTSIKDKKRKYTDQSGESRVNETLSNAQIPSAFLRNSVNQKVNYAFGKPFTINVENVTLNEEQNKDDKIGEEYLKQWQDYIDIDFRKALKHLAKNAINDGIGWVYVWIEADANASGTNASDGKLAMASVDSETIYPQWKDRAHTKLELIVRDYQVLDYEEDTKKIVNKVEYWDDKVVERFIDSGGELEIDVQEEGLEELPLATAHMKTDDGQAVSWGRVPFLCLKGCEDELPLLNVMRSQVDAYDLLTSKTVDSLVDDIDPVIIFRNISPEIGALKTARELLLNSRIASVDEGGDAYYLQVKADISATQQKLEHLRKDIREFSATVDTQDVKMGSNPSGVALRAMYQDLDIYVDGLEVEFEVFMNNFKYFFDRWLEFKGIGTVEQWEQYRLIVTLDRDMMVNEESLIENTVKLMQTGLSQETLDIYNPAVESHEIEDARREAQFEKDMEKQQELAKMSEFAKFATAQNSAELNDKKKLQKETGSTPETQEAAEPPEAPATQDK